MLLHLDDERAPVIPADGKGFVDGRKIFAFFLPEIEMDIHYRAHNLRNISC